MDLDMGEVIALDDLGRAVYGPRKAAEAASCRSEAWHCGAMAISGGAPRPANGLKRRNPGLAFSGAGKSSRP